MWLWSVYWHSHYPGRGATAVWSAPVRLLQLARGNAVRVEWKLDRQTVPEDEELIATLVVSGAANPNQVTRPDLGRLQPFESRFIARESDSP